jgi:hypothetical protein
MMSDQVASATRVLARRNAVTLLVAGTAVLALSQPAMADTRTVLTEADAYVSSTQPSANYGTRTDLVQDGSPTLTSYVRFAPNMSGVTKATLRVYTNTASKTGFEVRPVGSSSWSERTITQSNAPGLGSTVLGKSGAFARKQWISVDVTSAVNGTEPVTLAVKTGSAADFLLAARESGSARAPQLVLETGGTAPAPAPTPDPSPTPTPSPSPTPSPTPTPTATPAPAPAPAPSTGNAVRPYDPASPWNTPIGSSPGIDINSAGFMNEISKLGLPLSSDPDQYAIPVYEFNATTPRQTVKLSGYFSSYDAGDNSRKGYGFAPTITGVPIPENALQSAGSDGQIVIWDPVSGVEYSFWQFARDAGGNYTATNGYRYHTGSGYYGRFADGLAGRGAGTPYFAGLVRKWEIDQGRIDHALAFAYDSPSGEFRYPASKSDGGNFGGTSGTDLPEGARIQLDPTMTEADFNALGLSPAAKTIARALQSYGMYVIDHSGSSKIYLEDRMTAGWDTTINRNLVSKLPWSKFRVITAPTQP